MIRVAISVEGPTEEEFVKRVLASHLKPHKVTPVPIVVGPRGGSITIDRLALDMAKLSQSHNYVTSLVDFYGFVKKNRATIDQLERRINAAIDKKMQSLWQRSRQRQRVFAYIQKYELEGLLFSDVTRFPDVVEMPADSLGSLMNIRSKFSTPEDINDGATTAPSKRIVALVPRYRKRIHGPLLADAMGLATIRTECPRFDKWIARLESLSVP